jgi:hypothetical protein
MVSVRLTWPNCDAGNALCGTVEFDLRVNAYEFFEDFMRGSAAARANEIAGHNGRRSK